MFSSIKVLWKAGEKISVLGVATMRTIAFFLTTLLLRAYHNVNCFVAPFLVPLLHFLCPIVFFIVLTVRKLKTLLLGYDN